MKPPWMRDPVWRLINGGWDDQHKDVWVGLIGQIGEAYAAHAPSRKIRQMSDTLLVLGVIQQEIAKRLA